MESGTLIPRRLRWSPIGGRPRPSSGGWAVAVALGLAAAVGVVAGGGDWKLAVALVLAPAFLLVATAAPERTALGLLTVLPFLIYPASTGRFSIFLGLPMFGYTGLTLMLRQRGSLSRLRRGLPIFAFALLLAAAVVSAAASVDTQTAFTRVLYLLLFGWFAWALATALLDGRLSQESVVRAIVIGGAIAAVAVLAQFAAQFVSGRGAVLDWLREVHATFGGERAASAHITNSNWVLGDPVVLRGLFPFMAVPSAGQYLMLIFIAAVWLRREVRPATGLGAVLSTAAVVLIGLALLATFSRQAWIGAIVGVVLLGVSRKPLPTFAAVAATIVLVSVAPIPGGNGAFGDYLLTAADTSSKSSSDRLELWGQAIDQIPDHAAVGVGPGLYSTLRSPDPAHPYYYAHNTYLDSAVELGILGALAFIAVLVLGLRAAFRRRAMLAFSMISAFAVASVFDDVLYIPRNGLLLAAAFALIVASTSSPERPTTHVPR